MKEASWNVFRSLFTDEGKDPEKEIFQTLLRDDAVRIVRTVSTGQASGPYIQDEAEWVVVVQGSAELANAEGDTVKLELGDALYLPAQYEHSVTACSDPCVWLCVLDSAGDEGDEARMEEENESPDASLEDSLDASLDAPPNGAPLVSELNARQETFFREMLVSIRAVIYLPYANSLKDKRKVRQRVVAAMQKENLAAMEVARQDSHRELYLSIAGLALGEKEAKALETKVIETIHQHVTDGAYLQAIQVDLI